MVSALVLFILSFHILLSLSLLDCCFYKFEVIEDSVYFHDILDYPSYSIFCGHSVQLLFLN